MKINNISKSIALSMIFAAGCSMGFIYQNFSSNELNVKKELKKEATFSDTLSAALVTAEKDHVANQIALNVEPNQIEAGYKKNRAPSASGEKQEGLLPGEARDEVKIRSDEPAEQE